MSEGRDSGLTAVAAQGQASTGPHQPRHERAVANTLRSADAAAAYGDYAEAIFWLEMLEAIDEPLPKPYSAKRVAWSIALRADREQQDSQRPTGHLRRLGG